MICRKPWLIIQYEPCLTCWTKARALSLHLTARFIAQHCLYHIVDIHIALAPFNKEMATSPVPTRPIMVSPTPSQFDLASPTPSEYLPTISERRANPQLNLDLSLNSSFRCESSASLRADPRRCFSRLSSIGQSRVSLELSGNVSIELQTSRLDVKTPLEHPQPSKENSRRARLISRLIVGLAQGGSAKLEQYFHKFDPAASYGKRLITQRTPNIFDVRMFLKNPMPVGYFEVGWVFSLFI